VRDICTYLTSNSPCQVASELRRTQAGAVMSESSQDRDLSCPGRPNANATMGATARKSFCNGRAWPVQHQTHAQTQLVGWVGG